MIREELLDYTHFVVKHIERGVTPAWLVDNYMNTTGKALDPLDIYYGLCNESIGSMDRSEIIKIAMHQFADQQVAEATKDCYPKEFKERFRQKLFSMRATKEAIDKLSEADRLMMYGYHDCINEMLMWTNNVEQ